MRAPSDPYRGPGLHILCAGALAAVCLLLYLNSFDVPFYLDDFESIGNNRVISAGSVADVIRAHGMRAVTYLSFWADYQLRGPDPRGFHVTNLIIHTLNCWLVYILAWQVLRPAVAPGKTGRSPKKRGSASLRPLRPVLPALFAALLFACHPLHTQAVTYVVQRSASLVCFFYLATIVLYLCARTSQNRRRWMTSVLMGAVTFVAALFSKQNAFTLPLALLLTEWLLVSQRLPPRPRRERFLLLPLALPALLFLWLAASGQVGELGETLDRFTRDAQNISRLDYLMAQQNVVLMYLAKFLVPIQLRLEYDLRIDSFAAAVTALATAIHIALLALAISMRHRYPVVCFGTLFYYTAHLVESGLIPIKDLAFEHRSYLPDVGLTLVAGAVVARLLTDKGKRKTVIIACGGVIAVLALLTVQRNAQWRDPVSFYEREYRFSPEHPRVVANLSNRLINDGKKARALAVLRESYGKNKGSVPPQLASSYLFLFMETTSKDRTYQFGNEMRRQLEDPRARLPVLVNLGYFAMRQGDHASAESYLREAVDLPGAPVDARWALAISLQKQAKVSAARVESYRILEQQPRHEGALRLLIELGESP